MKRILATTAAVVASAAIAAPASASITPTLTLDQSAGTAAGSTVNLGVDLKFAPSGSDSPRDVTLALPAGLLANASIDGGACLKSATPMAACQVGTGTVSASETLLGLPLPVPLSLPVTFDLVAPPKPGDLAGLTLMVLGSPLGGPADITVRPSGDPAGVGLDIAFTNIPDTYLGLPISVDELNSTFDSLRLPARCPAPPANVIVAGRSYQDATTKTASAPLHVAGCSALPYAPSFKVTAVKDAADSGVNVVTDVTQKPGEATSRTVALTLPGTVLVPNVLAVLKGGILCTDPTLATCKTIGSASASSPFYPHSLSAKTYLTGSLAAPAITIVFLAPFGITLGGQVNLATNTTTFTGVPDIPLTDLAVTLSGGPDAVFMTTCASSSGTATATLTSQNGDHLASPTSAFTVANCTPAAGGGKTSGGGGKRKAPPGKRKPAHAGRPRLVLGSFSGLKNGKPTLAFGLVAGNNAPKLSSFAISLPPGLRFAGRRRAGRLRVEGVSLQGAKIGSISLAHGHLTITLRRAVGSLIVEIRHQGLAESAGLRVKAEHRRLRSLKLTVTVRDAKRKLTTLTASIKRLGL